MSGSKNADSVSVTGSSQTNDTGLRVPPNPTYLSDTCRNYKRGEFQTPFMPEGEELTETEEAEDEDLLEPQKKILEYRSILDSVDEGVDQTQKQIRQLRLSQTALEKNFLKLSARLATANKRRRQLKREGGEMIQPYYEVFVSMNSLSFLVEKVSNYLGMTLSQVASTCNISHNLLPSPAHDFDGANRRNNINLIRYKQERVPEMFSKCINGIEKSEKFMSDVTKNEKEITLLKKRIQEITSELTKKRQIAEQLAHKIAGIRAAENVAGIQLKISVPGPSQNKGKRCNSDLNELNAVIERQGRSILDMRQKGTQRKREHISTSSPSPGALKVPDSVAGMQDQNRKEDEGVTEQGGSSSTLTNAEEKVKIWLANNPGEGSKPQCVSCFSQSCKRTKRKRVYEDHHDYCNDSRERNVNPRMD
ncbi:unnamed protein product [Orchesella dallaii]|uniref:Uncharacterized protein n=1 Tax=Orchesella dallaii TaxID=48710 RepID=A0ABP1QJC2_9HEXA